MSLDEGPSLDDLERFSSESGYCPHCGEEVWDQAPYCSACNQPLEGVSSRPPDENWFRNRWLLGVVILVLIGFLLLFVL